MPDIYQNDHFVTFIISDYADVHIDAALKEISGSLNAFCVERRMRRIFS